MASASSRYFFYWIWSSFSTSARTPEAGAAGVSVAEDWPEQLSDSAQALQPPAKIEAAILASDFLMW
jgi:hypothetical protein